MASARAPDLPTRAFSLRQPWTWLVVNGHKPIENRGARWKLGRFFVHASKTMTEDEYFDVAEFLAAKFPHITLPPAAELELGGIVGMATHTGQILGPEWSGDHWHFEGGFGHVLKDIQKVPFVGCRGNRGLWPVPEEVLERVSIRLAEER